MQPSTKLLTKTQTQLLQTLYKFRFATTYLIAQSYGTKHARVIYARLKLLVEQGYVGKRYDASYRLAHLPAVYYLLPPAINYLKAHELGDPKALKALYNDRTPSEQFVDHWLRVFSCYIALKQQYADRFVYYARNELTTYDFMPQSLPDLYLRPENKRKSEYFVDYYDAVTEPFLHRQRIKKYLQWADSDNWGEATGSSLPTFLLVAETSKLEKRLRRIAEQELARSVSNARFLTANATSFEQGKNAIWQPLEASDKSLSL